MEALIGFLAEMVYAIDLKSIYLYKCFEILARRQVVWHSTFNREGAGSNPAGRTKVFLLRWEIGRM